MAGLERNAIVTGASSGIGRATALLLASRGVRVLATGRDEGRLAALGDDRIQIFATPIEEPEGRRAIIDEAHRRLGPVSILVNCAGRPDVPERPIFEADFDDMRMTLAVNLEAPFDLTRYVAQDIRNLGWGRIVMISSTAGQIGGPKMAGYCASKHGLNGLMKSVALDIAPFNATCNSVLPGWVRTAMADRDAETEALRRGITRDDVWAERAAGYPGGRVLDAEEIARVVAFLASDDASGINGETVTVSLGSLW
jgi:NAD(P)-dependent dehydrogenase (short-subunit alcohol dehydrogenase family)